MALLNTAIDEIERVALVGKDGEDLATAFVYSGGHNAEPQKNIPALHLTQAGAVADWQRHAVAFLKTERAATFRFAEIPKIERMMMTEKEDLGMRIAVTRYGVTSKIAVLSKLAPNSGETIAIPTASKSTIPMDSKVIMYEAHAQVAGNNLERPTKKHANMPWKE